MKKRLIASLLVLSISIVSPSAYAIAQTKNTDGRGWDVPSIIQKFSVTRFLSRLFGGVSSNSDLPTPPRPTP